ncbi:MAG: hypothetical protein AABX11_06315 [Nanoarchaeota archaeon]
MKREIPRLFEGGIEYPERVNLIGGRSSAQPSVGYGWGYAPGEEPKRGRVDLEAVDKLARNLGMKVDCKSGE